MEKDVNDTSGGGGKRIIFEVDKMEAVARYLTTPTAGWKTCHSRCFDLTINVMKAKRSGLEFTISERRATCDRNEER